MKTVHTSSMVAHLWANQSQDEARNAGNSFYFIDSVIYSYGSHFPIARHVQGRILFTTRSYSHTTAKHIHHVWKAIRYDASAITCDNVLASTPAEHTANLKDMREECTNALTKAMRARSYSGLHFEIAERCVNRHLEYRKLFGLDLDEELTIPEDWKDKAKERVQAQREQTKEAEKQKALRAYEAKLKDLKDLENWKLDPTIYRCFYDLPIALRLVNNSTEKETEDDVIQTSRGAEIPATHAKRIWKKVQEIKTTGNEYVRNGHTEYAGVFKVDRIQADGTLIAGCHVIEYTAMKELAERLGW